MFGPYRRFPFRGLALVALGFLLASVLAGGAPAFTGAAAGLGLVLLVPLFLFKMLFLFFLFGTFLRFAGGGRGWERGPGWGPPRHRHRRHEDPPTGFDDRWSDREQQEWEESLRQAREELRDYDSPFPRPPRRSDPPADDTNDNVD